MPDRLEPIDWMDGEPIRLPLAAILPPAGKRVQRMTFEDVPQIGGGVLVFLRNYPGERPSLRVDGADRQIILLGHLEGDWVVFTDAHWYYDRYDDYREEVLIEIVAEVIEELRRRFERKRWTPGISSLAGGLAVSPIVATTRFTYKGFPFAVEVRQDSWRGWTAILVAIPLEGRVSIDTYDELAALFDKMVGYYPSYSQAKLAVEAQLKRLARPGKRWGLLFSWSGHWHEREVEVEAGGDEPS